MPEREWMQLILQARKRIAPYLQPTPLHFYPLLSELTGAEIHVKHENYNPTGAFKVRGGINLLATLSAEERSRGVITASTGNHGQSIAYASHVFGIKATIGVPKNCNPAKLAAMRSWGAEMVIYGDDYDQCREKIESIAREQGMRYVHPANEPLLIAGVATIALEALEALPDADYIFCPVGGGSCCAGATLVARALRPSLQVIGVQAERASSAYESWSQKKLVTTGTADTHAEGLQTRVPFELTQSIMWITLKRFLTVGEEEIRQSMIHFLELARTLAEGAGAAPLAGILRCREEVRGKKVILYLSGGNASRGNLIRVLTDPETW
jgi:threonine dehydratase